VSVNYLDIFPRENRIVDLSEVIKMHGNSGLNPLFRFFKKVVIGADCWTWKGTTNRSLKFNGRARYGRFRLGSSPDVFVYVHRYMYELCHGPIPIDLEIHHTCFNSLCVNPAHLEAVSVTFNHRTHWDSVAVDNPDDVPF